MILGASGSGKGTVLAYLREKYPEFVFPVSCTTRSRRPNEVAGEVYDFVTRAEFESKIAAGDFLEWALVHDRDYYGTLKRPILSALEAGRIVVREVDIQGLKSIRAIVPKEQLVSIFLTVKSWEILEARILARSPMSEAELANRRRSYEIEKAWAGECDFVVASETGAIEKLCLEVEKTISAQIDV